MELFQGFCDLFQRFGVIDRLFTVKFILKFFPILHLRLLFPHPRRRVDVHYFNRFAAAFDSKRPRAFLHHPLAHVRSLQAHANRACLTQQPLQLALLQDPQTPVVRAEELRDCLLSATACCSTAAAAAFLALFHSISIAAPILIRRPPVLLFRITRLLSTPHRDLRADHRDRGQLAGFHLTSLDLPERPRQRPPAPAEIRKHLTVRVHYLRRFQEHKRAFRAAR
mmetsp:Transcript_2553/g.9880  ORF Transcript_2553/g.9880 Transcript_2553/m.9880 type:complete len:224 (+) Transcript_2553:202-873(+)